MSKSELKLSAIDANMVVALRAMLRERNVTRAGKAVGLTQSAMSHTLRRLRLHFDDPLLVPAGRSLVLTPLAETLVEPVGRAVAALELVFSRPPAFDPTTTRRVFHVAASDNLGLYVLPGLLALFGREAPRAALRVHPLAKDWPRALLDGDIDLKLGRTYEVPPGLRSQDLFEERFICVVAGGHASRPRRLSLAQFARLRHIVVQPTGNAADVAETPIDALLAEHGERRHVALSVPHFVVAPFVVAATDLTLTPAGRLIMPFVELLGLQQVELPFALPSYHLAQVWAARCDADPAHAWLRQAIVRVATLRPGAE